MGILAGIALFAAYVLLLGPAVWSDPYVAPTGLVLMISGLAVMYGGVGFAEYWHTRPGRMAWMLYALSFVVSIAAVPVAAAGVFALIAGLGKTLGGLL